MIRRYWKLLCSSCITNQMKFQLEKRLGLDAARQACTSSPVHWRQSVTLTINTSRNKCQQSPRSKSLCFSSSFFPLSAAEAAEIIKLCVCARRCIREQRVAAALLAISHCHAESRGTIVTNGSAFLLIAPSREWLLSPLWQGRRGRGGEGKCSGGTLGRHRALTAGLPAN